MLLRRADAVASSREQATYRVDGRHATEEYGHYRGTRGPPETSKVLVPLGKTNQQKNHRVREEGNELPSGAYDTIASVRNEPPARGEIPEQHATGERR